MWRPKAWWVASIAVLLSGTLCWTQVVIDAEGEERPAAPAEAEEESIDNQETQEWAQQGDLWRAIMDAVNYDIPPEVTGDQLRSAVLEKLHKIADLCEEYVRKYPRGRRAVDALSELIGAYSNLQRYGGGNEYRQKMLEVCDRIIADHPDTEQALDAHVLKLTDFRANAKYPEAIAEGLIIIQKWPKQEEVAAQTMMYLWDLYKRTKEPEKAQAVLEDLARKYPNTPAGRKALGIVERKNLVGKSPKLEFTAADGEKFALSDYTGRVVLVFYWGSFNKENAKVHEQVKQLYDLYREKGMDVVGVSVDSNKAEFEKAATELAATWKQVFDGNGWNTPATLDMGVTAVPSNMLIDRTGRVRYLDQWGMALRKVVVQLLQEK